MNRPRKPGLRIRGLLALVGLEAVLFALLRPDSRRIDATDAVQIARHWLVGDLARRQLVPSNTGKIRVDPPGSRPLAADNRLWVVTIEFTVGAKTIGEAYYIIATDGGLVGSGLNTSTSP